MGDCSGPTRVPGTSVASLERAMEPILQEGWLARRGPAEQAQERRRVVVTGLCVVAPSGVGAAAMWDVLRRGVGTVRPVSRFDVSEYPVRIAAQVPDFRPRQFMTALKARTASRFCQLTIVASRLAGEDADLADAALASSRGGRSLGPSAGP